ncbi:MAG: PAS domain-containing protein [Chlamydiales bacterium]|nr:PAS domain-containing protein [Chlamydiia bacterium]MCP5507929.1 PAS domain-containing protein [Chlamydiales bacterium]
MRKEFLPFLPVAEAVVALFYPHVEAVIHDCETDKIVAIYNNYSKRSPGDDALLDNLVVYPDYFPPYYKRNCDGRKIKSTSITIRDAAKRPIGLLCFNMDVSFFEQFQRIAETFLSDSNGESQPDALFANDWQEKISKYVHYYLKKVNLAVNALTHKQRREVVGELRDKGAFEAPKAADYAAVVLGVSRATIYNDLKRLP